MRKMREDARPFVELVQAAIEGAKPITNPFVSQQAV